MASLLTNVSAMSALTTLTATQSALLGTENQISTGLRVGTAADNAAYRSIATSMRTTNDELSAVNDSLNLGSSIVGTASAALNETISIMQKMSNDLVTAQQLSGDDKIRVETDIASLQTQLATTITSASFNGVNLLNQTATSGTREQVVSSVSGTGTGFTISTININYADTALTNSTKTGILDQNGSLSGASILNFSISAATTNGQLSNLSGDLDTALAKVETAAAKIGATQNNINLQSTFLTALQNAITTGIGSLVDADMNQASTRLSALQTQQQLGIQALAVANQSSQIILKLFS
jgi:flagellin